MNRSVESTLEVAILVVAAWPCLESLHQRRVPPRISSSGARSMGGHCNLCAGGRRDGCRLADGVAAAGAHSVLLDRRSRGLQSSPFRTTTRLAAGPPLAALTPTMVPALVLSEAASTLRKSVQGEPIRQADDVHSRFREGPGSFSYARRRTSSPPLWYGRFIPGGLMRHMPPADHEAYRDVFRDAFRPEAFEPLESFMTETMRSTMAAMARESATGGTAGIRPRPHVQRMMFVIWARLFFSVSADIADFPRLKACFRVIDARNPPAGLGRTHPEGPKRNRRDHATSRRRTPRTAGRCARRIGFDCASSSGGGRRPDSDRQSHL